MQRRAAPRLTLRLFDSNERECPEFNYRELIAQESRKRAENGDQRRPAAADDDDDDVEAIAKKFEQKYGGSSTYGKSKGRRKRDDYADIGAGYDENDSFIDNTDGYDEIIPPECDTACGGFYINSGSLEFKNVAGSNAGDAAGGDSSPTPARKSHKRPLSSSESEEESSSSSSDEESDVSRADGPAENNGRVTDSERSGEDASKKVRERNGQDSEKVSTKDKAARKKRKASQDGAAEKTPIATKKTPEVAVTNEAQAVNDNHQDGSSDSARSSDSSKPKPAVAVSDNRVSSDSSRDAAVPAVTVTAVPTTPPISALPSHTPREIQSLVQRLKTLADMHYSSRAGKLSGTEVNEIILGLELQCRQTKTISRDKHAIFAHAAQLMRRGKAGLLQRARRLVEDQQRTNPGGITSPMEKLKALIEKMRPSLIEQYKVESQKILEINKQIALQNANASSDDDKKVQERRLPKRIFPWNDQVRAALLDVLKNRGMNIDSGDSEEVTNFLQNIVLPMFPKGFVRMPTLVQQIRNAKLPNEAVKKRNSTPLQKPVTPTVDLKSPVDISRVQKSLSSPTIVSTPKTAMKGLGSLSSDKLNSDPVSLLQQLNNEKVLSVTLEKANVVQAIKEVKSDDHSRKIGGVIASPNNSSSISELDRMAIFPRLPDSVIVRKTSDLLPSQSNDNKLDNTCSITPVSSLLSNNVISAAGTDSVIKSLESVCRRRQDEEPHIEENIQQTNTGSIKVKSHESLFERKSTSESNSSDLEKWRQSNIYGRTSIRSTVPQADKMVPFNKPVAQAQDCSYLVKRKKKMEAIDSTIGSICTERPAHNFAKPVDKSEYANNKSNNSHNIPKHYQHSDIINGNAQREGVKMNSGNKSVYKYNDVDGTDLSSHNRPSVTTAKCIPRQPEDYNRKQEKSEPTGHDSGGSSDDCVEILTDEDSPATNFVSPKLNVSPKPSSDSTFRRFNSEDDLRRGQQQWRQDVKDPDIRNKWMQSIAKANITSPPGMATVKPMQRPQPKSKDEVGDVGSCIRGDVRSVIKDFKADRLIGTVPGVVSHQDAGEDNTTYKQDIDQVMNDLRRLEDFQMQGGHQRLYDDPGGNSSQ